MRFSPTPLAGSYLVTPDPVADHRGFFARSFCEREFSEAGLCARFVQCNISFNERRGTLRGMHFQRDPSPEPKLVRCTRGAAFDAIVDLRRDSSTWKQWWSIELSSVNRLAVYIPPGFAHGFQTLADDTELFYQMGDFYVPQLAGGVRWDDPAFTIRWPLETVIISDKDRAYPDYK